MNWKVYIRVEWKINNLFYIFSPDNYDTIHKFHIIENWKKELVKSMYGNTIRYMWEIYTRIITEESWIFYINVKNHKKLYKNDKLVNFLKQNKDWECQIDTY